MFKHSVKVPRIYKIAARIVQEVKEEGASLKHLVFQAKHPNIKALHAIVLKTLQHGTHLDFIIRRTELLHKESRLNAWLARVLITELLWGKQRLAGDAKPIKTVLSHQREIESYLPEIADYSTHPNNKVKKPRYVRVNLLKMTTAEAIHGFQDEGWTYLRNFQNTYEDFLSTISRLEEGQFTSDFHLDYLLIFPARTEFYNHPSYLNGCIILQDKASCIPPYLLNPVPGSTTLDMCAAPGMKTSQLAAIINNNGSIIAVERDLRRFETLNYFKEVTGSTCVETVNRDVLTLNDQSLTGVEYILVDPTCSGSGMVDRYEVMDAEEKSNPARLEKLAGFQITVLKHALKHFQTAVRVVYSTCSVHPEENEAVVQTVLESCYKYKLVDAKALFNKSWINVDSEDFVEISKKCLYIRPEIDFTNGFFIAVFERLSDEEIKLRQEERKAMQQVNNEQGNWNDENTNEIPNKWKRHFEQDDFIKTKTENVCHDDAYLPQKKCKTKSETDIGDEGNIQSLNYDNIILRNTPAEHVKQKKYENEKKLELCVEDTLTIENLNASEPKIKKNKSKKKMLIMSVDLPDNNELHDIQLGNSDRHLDNYDISSRKQKKVRKETHLNLTVEDNPIITEISAPNCNRKKKLKNKTDVTPINDDAINYTVNCNNADGILENGHKLPHKKKKKSKDETQTFDLQQNLSITNLCVSTRKNKSAKVSDNSAREHAVDDTYLCQNSKDNKVTDQNMMLKRKKKKKSFDLATNQDIETELVTIKKKKKSKISASSSREPVVVDDEYLCKTPKDTNESLMLKKKKKKDSFDLDRDQEIETELRTLKKKKKSKISEASEPVVVDVANLSKNAEEIKDRDLSLMLKKKKKNRTLDVAKDLDIDMQLEIPKKKKKSMEILNLKTSSSLRKQLSKEI